MKYHFEEYNNSSASKYRKLWARLQEFLDENDLGNLINVNKGEKSLNCDLIDCDYFDFLNGNEKAIKSLHLLTCLIIGGVSLH